MRIGISIWKKLLCLVLCACFTFSFAFVGKSSAQGKQVIVKSFSADNFGIEIGHSAEVTFSAKISGVPLNARVAVYDNNGNLVTKLSRVSDEEYKATVHLTANKKATNVYHLRVDDKKYGEHEIRFYNKLSDADLAKNDALWRKIDGLRDTLKSMGYSNKEIVDCVYNFLSDNPDIEILRYETETTLNFETYSGICNAFTIREERSAEQIEAIEAEIEELSEVYSTFNQEEEYELKLAPTSKDIGVYAPYYGVQSDFTMKYVELAKNVIKSAMGGSVYGYYGNGSHGYPRATVVSFKNWSKYGLIMVDSHGDLYNGKVVICVSAAAKGTYDSADVSQGHLIQSSGDVLVRATYIQKYCPSLPNSIIYMGICYGMYNNTMYSPLLNIGASAVIGYDNPVSFYYDNQMMNELFRRLCKVDEGTGKLYTVAEGVDYAKKMKGQYDPYSSYRAKLVYQGSGSARLSDVGAPVPVTGVTMAESATIKVGETLQLNVSISPNDATDYLIDFESIQPDVASVSWTGLVTGIEEGTATIVCTVYDNVSGETFYANCKVTVEPAPPTYTVYFRDWNGSLLDIQVVEEGEDAVLPEDPEREGYIFSGWDGDHRNIKQNTTITAMYIQIGDANGDGKVNTGDATYVLSYTIGNIELSDLFEKVADANQDGVVNTGDAIRILLLAVK